MIRRQLYVALGFAFMAIGIVGIVLPVLPTTPFMLLALWAFARGSRRFHDWLFNHQTFGPPLQRWNNHGVIPTKTKITALAIMCLSLVYIVGFSNAPPLAVAVAAALMLVGATFIVTRPSRAPGSESETEPGDDQNA
jgi:uncharacterized membrane protein YbaN (DUF454 family)